MHTEEEYQQALKRIEELEKELKESENKYSKTARFMARTSHEIRTPMNSIIGLATLGEAESYGRSAGEYFRKIKEAGEYQLEILGDILDMAKIESGGVVLYPEAYDLEDLADNVSAVITPLMQQKEIDFNFELHDLTAKVLMADKLRLKQILMNLLSNAAKFTPERGRVDFIISQDGVNNGKVRTTFVIRDNGIGMSDEFMERIFMPFEQDRNAGTADIQGTGLGLTIAKSFTDIMGGTMSVRSKQGEGTEFTVQIEFEPAEETEVKVRTADPESIDFSGKRALIADDHSINRVLEVKLLKRGGFETDVVVNGFECVKKFMASGIGEYDVILMDIKMPVMDGLEASRKIRELGRGDAKTVKIIAMSASSYPEDIAKCFAAGMNGHVSKPVIPAVLYTKLEELLGD